MTDAASLAVDNAEVTGTPAAMVAQLKQGAHSLRQQRRQVLAGEQPDASLADRAAQLRQLLQPACELAGLFQQWLQLRGTVVQELLVASQAVTATRSCAYLRCANVAGQGVGTAKCRWGQRELAVRAFQEALRNAPAAMLLPCCNGSQPIPSQTPCTHSQGLPRGAVLRHRLLPRRVAGGAQARVQGARGAAAGGQGGAGGGGGGGRWAAAARRGSVSLATQCRACSTACTIVYFAFK